MTNARGNSWSAHLNAELLWKRQPTSTPDVPCTLGGPCPATLLRTRRWNCRRRAPRYRTSRIWPRSDTSTASSAPLWSDARPDRGSHFRGWPQRWTIATYIDGSPEKPPHILPHVLIRSDVDKNRSALAVPQDFAQSPIIDRDLKQRRLQKRVTINWASILFDGQSFPSWVGAWEYAQYRSPSPTMLDKKGILPQFLY